VADDDASATFRRGTLLVVGLLVAAAYVGGALVAGIGEALQELTGAALVPVLGAVAGHVIVTLLWPQVHRASVRAVGERIRYREALSVSMSAFTLSHTMPGGGAVGATVAVNRLTSYGLSGPAATASVTLTGLLSVVTIAGLGAAGVAAAVVTDDLPGIALAGAAGALVVLVAVSVGIVLVLRSPAAGDRLVGWVGRLPKLGHRVQEWRSSLREVTEDDPPTVGDLARIVVWSTCKWTADIASLALLFVAFGQTPRLTILLVGFAVSQLAAAIPITPGGVGFVEGGMVAAFVVLGASASLATTVVLAYRLIETWLPTLAGVPVLLRPADGEDVDEDAGAGASAGAGGDG
jgi:uncharacterized protein (TIRG00374 family)